MRMSWSPREWRPRVALAVFLALMPGSVASSSLWPLDKYEACGLAVLPTGAAGSSTLSSDSTPSLSLDVDDDVLWATSGSTLFRYRFSTLELVSSQIIPASAFSSVQSGKSAMSAGLASPTSLGVVHMGGGRVALIDKVSSAILMTDPTSSRPPVVISLEYPVQSLTYDAAYEVFYGYASSVDAVVQIDMDGDQRVMFGAWSKAWALLGDNPITDLHYAGNTGTLFVLCSGCGVIFEFTMSGNLRRSSARDGVDGFSAISFSRTGSKLLLMDSKMRLESLCQDIPPLPPVLPPEKATTPVAQTWFPLNTYFFCGEWPYENHWPSAVFKDMTVDPTTRTVWAIVGNSVREYSLRGELLRRIDKWTLFDLGLPDIVTSIAYIGPGRFALGVQQGNWLAVANMVPEEAQQQMLEIYAKESGANEDELEPPGEEYEQEMFRKLNLVSLEDIFTVDWGLLEPNSLGSISYSPEVNAFIVQDISQERMAWVSATGSGGGGVLLDDLKSLSPEVDDFIYSVKNGEFLLWCSSCSSIVEASATMQVKDEKFFPPFFAAEPDRKVSTITATPDGYLLILATQGGEVNFYCSNGETVADNMVKDSTGSGGGGVDLLYFWRSQELENSPASPSLSTRSVAVLPEVSMRAVQIAETEYMYLDNQECEGSQMISTPFVGVSLLECEKMCSDIGICTAYEYDLSRRACELMESCAGHGLDYSKVSAVQLSEVQPGPPTSPPSSSPGDQTPLPGSGGVVYLQADNSKCNDAAMLSFKDATLQQCQDFCSVVSACTVVTYVAGDMDCTLHETCWLPEVVVGSLTALKLSDGSPTDGSKTDPLKTSQTCCEDLPNFSASRGTDSAVCGASLWSGQECVLSTCWDAAKAICEATGARLCTGSEVFNGEAQGTGCGIDFLPVWTQEPCSTAEGESGFRALPGKGGQQGECLKPIADQAAMRCCADSCSLPDAPTQPATTSEKCCQVLEETLDFQKWFGPDPAICGDSKWPGQDCMLSTPWESARAMCETAGARLCSAAEVFNGEVQFTGCGIDPEPVWTLESCVTGEGQPGYLTLLGRGGSPPQCVGVSAGQAAMRCCADACVVDSDPPGSSLVGGWQWDGERDCSPWEDTKCGLSSNPGLKIDGITWYRMYAHEANPLTHIGDGVMEWTPFRVRKEFGNLYWKGSEILGYLDQPMAIKNVGESVEMWFLWSSEGEVQDEICPASSAKDIDCDQCEVAFNEVTGQKYIYHEVRCYSGTGDFRIGLLDSRGNRFTKDGYGYYDPAKIDFRGLQWRFHPHACPTTPREKPNGYTATAASSWIRNNIFENKINREGLIVDFIENDELGDRSFQKRIFDPADDGACLNLANGAWTPDDKPLKMKLTLLERSNNEVTFDWRMEFNGWSGSKVETWPEDLFPYNIDSMVVGYTNSRSFTSMKLKRIK